MRFALRILQLYIFKSKKKYKMIHFRFFHWRLSLYDIRRIGIYWMNNKSIQNKKEARVREITIENQIQFDLITTLEIMIFLNSS